MASEEPARRKTGWILFSSNYKFTEEEVQDIGKTNI